eukprot:CAMPEP_0202703184 /NCGR_PEP_ID=MMETSP1385-20130828/16057_1 /ASSEMBLY_ACC=CAM_ASM_000861 /TAXON_ID=933848 /ORGANISM="Elphidium margaritaceum" /LENGTH=102 /DNA_ID=CAMNT_0049360985 /DNA_START=162 /DNA_END=466 /DNA_ORIENTATION=+
MPAAISVHTPDRDESTALSALELDGLVTPENLNSSSWYILPSLGNQPVLRHCNTESKNSICVSALQLPQFDHEVADSNVSLLERDLMELRFENEKQTKQIDV